MMMTVHTITMFDQDIMMTSQDITMFLPGYNVDVALQNETDTEKQQSGTIQ